jgi:membrane-associated phospholipid phosphatase
MLKKTIMRYKTILFTAFFFTMLIAQNNTTDYFKNGLTNSISTKNNQIVLVAGLIGTGIALKYDNSINSYAQSHVLMPDPIAMFGDYWGIGGQVLLWGAILSSGNKSEKFRYASSAFVVNGLLTYGLKYGVKRERPDESNKRSFPSGHTSNSFLTASIVQEIYGSKAGIPAYLLAWVTGLSRIHDNKHYLSDVIFGAAMGTAIGQGFGKVYRNNQIPRIGIIHLNQNLKINIVWAF